MVGETADGRGQGKDLGDRIFLQEEVRIREQNNSDTFSRGRSQSLRIILLTKRPNLKISEQQGRSAMLYLPVVENSRR